MPEIVHRLLCRFLTVSVTLNDSTVVTLRPTGVRFDRSRFGLVRVTGITIEPSAGGCHR